MKKNMKFYNLGASLYIPATNDDLIKIAIGEKYPNLKSIVIDTEDSIDEKDLEVAYHNIKKVLNVLEELRNKHRKKPMIFIRTRNLTEYDKLKKIKTDNGNSLIHSLIDGVVFPKVRIDNLKIYLQDFKFKYCMPIFEDSTIPTEELKEIKELFMEKNIQDKILSIRIGATDILSNFNLRRNAYNVIYDFSQVNYFITKMVNLFNEFNISAPVYECFNGNNSEEKSKVLSKETKMDLMNGLFGKTIIHPWQIDIVQEEYKVFQDELEIATELLNPYAKPVFKMHDRMNEKTTHTNWAKAIIKRSEIYGVKAQ